MELVGPSKFGFLFLRRDFLKKCKFQKYTMEYIMYVCVVYKFLIFLWS